MINLQKAFGLSSILLSLGLTSKSSEEDLEKVLESKTPKELKEIENRLLEETLTGLKLPEIGSSEYEEILKKLNFNSNSVELEPINLPEKAKNKWDPTNAIKLRKKRHRKKGRK